MKVKGAYKDFWAKVERHGRKSCWPWRGAIGTQGYGNIKYEGKYVHAHRVAYALKNGPIPPGVWVLHHCDNPPCCNPAHLFLGDAKANSADAKAKGRTAQKERHGRRKLFQREVDAIRRRHANGRTGAYLARQYGVSYGTISLIVNNKVWVRP
jgi:hypothetical protein